MRLALVTPYSTPIRGNSVTVQRIEAGLRGQGQEVHVFSLDRQAAPAIREALGQLRPDVVHGFHARAAGPLVTAAARDLHVPAVITLTGTDVNLDLFDPVRRPLVLEALRRSQALVAFHASIRDKVLAALPELARGDRIRVIPQAVRFDPAQYDLREQLSLPDDAFVAFQPAGIRRVKNIPSILPPLAATQREHSRLRYVLAGPVLEPAEGEEVQARLRDLSWATYLGPIPHDTVCAILPQVQVVISSSLSEGGMSNAVLEAMDRGVPVLASDIEGNRSMIVDGQDGLLYASEAEFRDKLARLLADPGLGARLGQRAQEKIRKCFRPEDEIQAHLRLYRSLLASA